MQLYSSKRSRNRGQAMLESALVLMVLIATLIGILDFGQVVFVHQALVNQARRGARYGAVNFTDTEQIKNFVLYGQPTVPANPSKTFMGLKSSMVTVTRASQGTNDDRIVVRISNYPYRFFSPWIAGLYTARAATAAASVEGT